MKSKKTDELLDLVDKNDNLIGTVWKSEVHGNPDLIHREIAVAVFFKDEILLQQRSSNKKVNPSYWTISVQGHVSSSEAPEKAARREVFEELGLNVIPVYFDKKLVSDDYESFYVYVFYCFLENKTDLILDLNEVANVSWIKIANLKNFMLNNKFDKEVSEKLLFDIFNNLKII